MSIRRFSVLLGAVVAMSVGTGLAQASSVTLATLISTNGVIIQGDKEFSNFSYTATGDMPTAAGVNVTGIGTGVGTDYIGIEFQGSFSDNVGGGASDAAIQYTVTVLNPAFVITDAHLGSNLVVNGEPNSNAKGTIDETFNGVTGFLENFNFDNVHTKLTDEYDFGLPGETSLNVVKDIALDAGDTTNGAFGDVGLSVIDQTFSQTQLGGSSQVPTPQASWMGLSLMGAIGAFSVMRKRRSMA